MEIMKNKIGLTKLSCKKAVHHKAPLGKWRPIHLLFLEGALSEDLHCEVNQNSELDSREFDPFVGKKTATQ